MTNKELQKLGRRELLQLLLEQAKETERLGKLLKENGKQLKRLEESCEGLRDRLDKKDAQIHQLKDELQSERDKLDAVRFGGGFAPAQQMEQVLPRAQGCFSVSSGAPAPDLSVSDPGFQAPDPCGGQYQPPPAAPYGGPYCVPAPDPFPYQAPAQSREPILYQPPEPDPFPYQVPYREEAAPEPYSMGAEVQYPYPEPRPGRKRQNGQHGKMPFRLKKDQEHGKTTLFFGWQHN